MASRKATRDDMEHVWKDISDTWERLTEETAGAPFALTREIDKAGKFTDEIVDKIYARYEFCEGFTNKQLDKMKSLALSTKGSLSEAPLELKKLRETLAAREARENPFKNGQPAKPANGKETLDWKVFNPETKSTWPEHHQNVVFGPTFSFPISAQFKDGKWFRQGTDQELKGVTKYLHLAPPQDWG